MSRIVEWLRSGWPLWSVASLIFESLAVYSTVHAIQDRAVEQQLQCCATAVQARVINRWEVHYPCDGLECIQHHISYVYEAPQPITKGDEEVSQDVYASALPGELITIRYLASDPSVSRIDQNSHREPFLEMAILWWLALIPTLMTLFSKLRRAVPASS